MLPLINATPPGADSLPFKFEQPFTTDVLVLGAGISGLACAAHLRSAGLRVIVLEARHRLGGRLHTIVLHSEGGLDASCPQQSYAVDLGAAWVHGIGNAGAPNQLYSLACELGLGCRPTDYSDAAVYTAEGLRLGEQDVADIERLYQVFEQHLHSMLHAPDPRLALMTIQAAQEAFASIHGLSAAQSAALSYAVSNHMEHYWAGEARSMGVAALDEVVLPGGDVVLTEGYGAIVGRLAAGLDVRQGHEVVAVQYGGSGGGRAEGGVAVTARVGGGEGGVVTLTARAAVVTLPIAVLQSGIVEFSPPLAAVDPGKAAAISRLGVAVYNKVVMLYDPADVFWDDTAFIYRIPAPWEVGRWSYFLNLHKVTGAPILVAFNLGEAARQLESGSDAEVVEGALQALTGMYGTARVRRPRQAVVTRWGSDPHSRMSYTYVPAGVTGAAFDDLARPILDCLFFAGEATHRPHYGTAHGAYDSGRLAASAIVRQFLTNGIPLPPPQPLPLPAPPRKWPLGRFTAVTAAPAKVVAAAASPPLQLPARTQPRSQPRWRSMRGDVGRVATAATVSAASTGSATATAAHSALAATPLCLVPTGGIQPAAWNVAAASPAAAVPPGSSSGGVAAPSKSLGDIAPGRVDDIGPWCMEGKPQPRAAVELADVAEVTDVRAGGGDGGGEGCGAILSKL